MIKKLYLYIFGKSYWFCMNILKEREFPYVWAGGAVAFLSFVNIRLILQIIEYFLLPYRLDIYYDSHKYLILVHMAIIVLYVYRKKRYLKILEKYESISKNKSLRILSILYYIIIFGGFFLMSDVFREYNLTHQ